MTAWPEAGTARRSISTVTRPFEVSRFYSQHFPERCPPEATLTDGQHYAANVRFFHEEPAAYSSVPVFDPRRFSPPQLDTPPATQPDYPTSFSFNQWNDAPRVPPPNTFDTFDAPAENHNKRPPSTCDPSPRPQFDPPNTFDVAHMAYTNGVSSKDEMAPLSIDIHSPTDMDSVMQGGPNSQLLASIQRRPFVAEKARSISIARKPSVMAQKSQLRSPRVSDVSGQSGLTPYTPPPILSPLRSGSGLYWQAKQQQEDSPDDEGMSPPLAPREDGAPEEADEDEKREERADGHSGDSPTSPAPAPTRKNGFFCMGNETSMALELEALRKDSCSSSCSAKSTPCLAKKMSWSTETSRKASSVSDCYYDVHALTPRTDSTPHINIGREYQARVKKWSERVVLREELDAIEDKDELVFDCKLIDHLEEEQLVAYEFLACSCAVPRPGRNKELALHLLMENKGNLEAAVMDLLRSDILDWEQYPTIYNYLYNDTVPWSPEQIQLFQEALYKTEKDFHQVSLEIGLPVKVCVEWYYTWKKALPDDYRKLRNLRRKRRLLEISLDAEANSCPKNGRLSEEDEPEEVMDAADPFVVRDPLMCLDRPRMGAGMAPVGAIAAEPSPVHKNSGQMYPQSVSPSLNDFAPLQHKYQPCNPRSSKKGAQPAADGFFHCRLCDKCFEKVKSLNAHMKSHAMKARAEAEARAQFSAPLHAPHFVQHRDCYYVAVPSGAPLPMQASPLQQRMDVDAQLQQLGLAGTLLGQTLEQRLLQAGIQPSPIPNPHSLSGFHLAPIIH